MTTMNADPSLRAWVERRVSESPYWFHKLRIYDDLVTPGWSDPAVEKLPIYGLPERMDGMRVLDVGCAEGFFSFEAERRGAAEVVAIDSFSDSIERFQIVRAALGSKVRGSLCNVYDISPRTFGTFDLVMFFGVLYHLKHPWLALEKIFSVCSGDMLLQTLVTDEPQYRDLSLSWFHPFGIESGPPDARQFDPTVFWVPTPECTKNLARAVGFVDVADVTNQVGAPFVMRASAQARSAGTPPDPMKAPWS
jgi:tRNA (mo5U34)-methyltransferase